MLLAVPASRARRIGLPRRIEAPLTQRDMAARQVHHARLLLAARCAFDRALRQPSGDGHDLARRRQRRSLLLLPLVP
jgi:hypothetical protein